MKKIFFVTSVLLFFVFVSCKKNYTCTCTGSYTYIEYDMYGNPIEKIENYSEVYRVKEASKKQAQAACVEVTLETLDGKSSETCSLSK